MDAQHFCPFLTQCTCLGTTCTLTAWSARVSHLGCCPAYHTLARVGGHHSTSPTRSADQHCISVSAQFGRSSDNAHTACVCRPRLRTCRTQQQQPPTLVDHTILAIICTTSLTLDCTQRVRNEPATTACCHEPAYRPHGCIASAPTAP